LNVAAGIPAGAIDLIYADPPFFTKREQKGNTERQTRNARRVQGGKPSELSFEDRWQGGRHEYLAWLEARVRAMRGLLKPGGVFLLHLDWHAVHYAKVMCDVVFGEAQFQNELIWYYQTGGASKDRFSRKHDNILVYSMGETFYFNGHAVAIPRTPKAMKRAQCATGARILSTDTHKNPDDVITVPALNPMARERTGYPTQKPLTLMEMLIKALCPPEGGVADLFCGSGTTLVAAKRLGRKWMGGDANEAALEMTRRRLEAGDPTTPPLEYR
jgi:site-specific DNA-methyltransferase (adenine-specific)/adenine-specific DNA-methyltransferase